MRRRELLTGLVVAASVVALTAQAAQPAQSAATAARPPAGTLCGVGIFVTPGATADAPNVDYYPLKIVCPVGAKLVFALFNTTDAGQTIRITDFTHQLTGRKLDPRDRPGADPTLNPQVADFRRDTLRVDAGFKCTVMDQTDCGDYKYTIVVGKTTIDPGLQVTPPSGAPSPASETTIPR